MYIPKNANLNCIIPIPHNSAKYIIVENFIKIWWIDFSNNLETQQSDFYLLVIYKQRLKYNYHILVKLDKYTGLIFF